MKFCKDCNFSKKEQFQTPAGWQSVMLCQNMECRDPVSGDMIPCEIARREQVFCGIQAKHFKQKEEQRVATLVEIAK